MTRQSIQPTYDSRETGPAYTVTSRIYAGTWRQIWTDGGRPIDDPFVRQTVHISMWDLLRGLLRGQLIVEVVIGGDKHVMDDVLELDANQTVPGRTRRIEFQQGMHSALKQFGAEEVAA